MCVIGPSTNGINATDYTMILLHFNHKPKNQMTQSISCFQLQYKIMIHYNQEFNVDNSGIAQVDTTCVQRFNAI